MLPIHARNDTLAMSVENYLSEIFSAHVLKQPGTEPEVGESVNSASVWNVASLTGRPTRPAALSLFTMLEYDAVAISERWIHDQVSLHCR